MKNIIIMGAAGRDFHNFNVCYRENPEYKVVAFTAAQIPGIEDRIYPPSLSGPSYPQGIPIHPEEQLPRLIKELEADQVLFAYSDISHLELMHKASLVLGCGADFILKGPKSTMLPSKLPVIAVTATRTGSGKSQVSRYIGRLLLEAGRKVAVVRHPMPYGRLEEQRAQRFSSYEDLDRQRCTLEEREEYEPLIDAGLIVYAGVDYGRVLEMAEADADVIIWDGGNNDFPFFLPDLNILVADPLRIGDESTYHPGETNLHRMDIAIINKVDSADPEKVEALKVILSEYSPSAPILLCRSRITVAGGEQIRGRKVLVIEDGPTLTHGEMTFGAGVLAAERFGALELVDPRPYAVGSIAEALMRRPALNRLLPAMGYGGEQLRELEESINQCPADLVVIGTPIDLSRVVRINKPTVRVRYELEEIDPCLGDLLKDVLTRKHRSFIPFPLHSL